MRNLGKSLAALVFIVTIVAVLFQDRPISAIDVTVTLTPMQYLAIIKKIPTPTPTSTPTLTPTPTNTPTPKPTATKTPTPTRPPATSGDVRIISIFYDGTGSQEPDEYVEIKNYDSNTIQLHNWTLRDIANHVYTFPNFLMAPGKVCRIYTNQWHAAYCNFNYQNGAAIWNNGGDCGYLRNSAGSQIDQYCY